MLGSLCLVKLVCRLGVSHIWNIPLTTQARGSNMFEICLEISKQRGSDMGTYGTMHKNVVRIPSGNLTWLFKMAHLVCWFYLYMILRWGFSQGAFGWCLRTERSASPMSLRSFEAWGSRSMKRRGAGGFPKNWSSKWCRKNMAKTESIGTWIAWMTILWGFWWWLRLALQLFTIFVTFIRRDWDVRVLPGNALVCVARNDL